MKTSSGSDGDPRDWTPPPPGWRLRGILLLLPAVLFAFSYVFLLILVLLLLPGWSRRHRTGLIRAWGRSLLWLFGVKLELHGLENRDIPGAKILATNHVSLLDLMVYSAAWADNGTVIYKKEFGKIPLIGRCMRLLGFVAVDRRNPEAARKSMAEAAEGIRERGLAVWIAPEGTRSRQGGLQEFKMGAFHLALQTGAPIVPTIMRGVSEVNPMGSLIVRPGTVRVDFLAPVFPNGWTRATLRRNSRDLRAVFLQYLPAAEGPGPS